MPHGQEGWSALTANVENDGTASEGKSKRSQWVTVLVLVVVVLLVASIGSRWGPTVGMMLAFLVALLVILVRVVRQERARSVWGILGFALPLSLVWFIWPVAVLLVGSYSQARDTTVFLAALLIIGNIPLSWFKTVNRELSAKLLGILLATWIITSSMNCIWERGALLPASEPFATRNVAEDWQDVKLGLALSGGGYRAAVMHAGVLHELDVQGIPITHLSSVSGGSIIAAFYTGGGAPESFLRAVKHGRFRLARDLFDFHNLIRLPFPLPVPGTDSKVLQSIGTSRFDVQANLLDRVLYDGLSLKALHQIGGPELLICVTDLATGHAVGLSYDAILERPLPGIEDFGEDGTLLPKRPMPYPPVRTATNEFPANAHVARLVAASGAFPVAFNCLRVPRKRRTMSLADGGITDNLGLTLLVDRHRQSIAMVPRDDSDTGRTATLKTDADPQLESSPASSDAQATSGPSWKLDLVIVSDGGKPFEMEPLEGYAKEPGRAFDVVYANSRLSWATEPVPGLPVIRLSPEQITRELDAQDLKYVIDESGEPHDVVLAHMIELRDVFMNTGTLTEDLGARAESLFRLGRDLVLLNMSLIETCLRNNSTQPSERERDLN